MDKKRLIQILAAIDDNLESPGSLCIYGSGAFILLDEEDRTSLDLDIAAPYSSVNFSDFSRAVRAAGIAINPEEDTNEDHIEWISFIRLCLAKPDTTESIVLWEGNKLKVFTVSPADLIASKLIRYDEIDQSDIHYLVFQMNLSYESIVQAAKRLPEQFRNDAIVRENLANLEQDMESWRNAE
ncbi:DUF6036 family nucleotidyltransferase [Planctomycetota bacterium]